MNLKLIDKYIFKQVLGATLVCIALFIIVWLAPETLVNIMKDVSTKTLTVSQGLLSALYSVPNVLSKALPVGLLLGCLYTFNRMSKDSELTVIRSSGINFWRIIVTPVILSIVFSIVCFFVYDRMIPFAANGLKTIKAAPKVDHFVYAVKDENKNLEQLVIIKYYGHQIGATGIIVLNFNKKDASKISLLSDIIVSKNAKFADTKWDLTQNKKYIIKYDGVYKEIQSPKKVSILHGKKAGIVKQLMDYNLKRDREREFTNKDLKHYLYLLKTEEIDDLYGLNLNFYLQRFFHSAICIVFAILGCLLGYSNPREQKLIGFTIAVGIIFLYYMSLPFFNHMAERGILSPWITASIQPILIIILIYFYKKHKGL